MKPVFKSVRRFVSLAAALCATAVAHAEAVYPHFFVGVDSLPTITSGTYAGLPNPNYNRLSFLIGHTHEPASQSHFHSVGIYSYAGGAANPAVLDTNANNRIPELSQRPTGVASLSLLPTGRGSNGVLRSLSGYGPFNNYEGLSLAAPMTLSAGTETQQAIYNSGGGRWSSSLGDAVVGLELVSITPGLSISNLAGERILANVGDVYTLGAGDGLGFEPVFWADAFAAPGTYSAEFRLRDLRPSGAALGTSGRFSFDFEVK